MTTYKIQSKHETLGWRSVPFAESRTKAYCDGWMDCMDFLYPSRPLRLLRIIGGKALTVRETKGRAAPHTN